MQSGTDCQWKTTYRCTWMFRSGVTRRYRYSGTAERRMDWSPDCTEGLSNRSYICTSTSYRLPTNNTTMCLLLHTRLERGLGPFMDWVGLDWIRMGHKITTFMGWGALGRALTTVLVQTGGEKSQIFIAILLIAFCQRLIVNRVLDTKHKYISCFCSTHTC